MEKKLIKRCATGTGIFAACCFGILGLLLGTLGLTTALAYVNNYGDYVFFPAYAVFGTVFVYALMQWKKNIYTYLLSLITIAIMIYFSIFGFIWLLLILGGIAIGGTISWIIHKKAKC